MATPRACQCFKFTGKIRTMFNQINPHHFSCLYKMTFERHAVKALRCCDAPRTDRPQRCRRHRGAGENAAVCDGATTTESSSEDDCSPSPTPDTGFRPRSFTVSVFDRLQLNVGLLSDSSTDDFTPWAICKQTHLPYRSSGGGGLLPGGGPDELVPIPVSRRGCERNVSTRPSTDVAGVSKATEQWTSPIPGKRPRPGTKRIVYVAADAQPPIKTPAPDTPNDNEIALLLPPGDGSVTTPDSGNQMKDPGDKEETRLPEVTSDGAGRRVGSAGEGHCDKPTRHCWVLQPRQATLLCRSATYQGRSTVRDGLQIQAKPPRAAPMPRTRTKLDASRSGGASR